MLGNIALFLAVLPWLCLAVMEIVGPPHDMYFGCLLGSVALVLALAIASGRARRSERGKRAAAAIRGHFFGDGEVDLGCLLGLVVPVLLLPIALGRILRSQRGRRKGTATVPERPFITGEQDGPRMTATVGKPSLALRVNTVVLVGSLMIWHVLVAIALAESWDVPPHRGSIMAIIGAVVSVPFLAVFCLCCYRSVFRCSQVATRILTHLYFAGAGLTVLALTMNIGEAVMEAGDLAPDLLRFLVTLAGICVLIAAYLNYCGVLSLHWQRRLREHAASQSLQTDG